MSNSPFPTTSIVDGNSLVLENLANKVKRGHDLTNVESYMGITSARAVAGPKFGPDITEINIDGVILPEKIKGMIVSAAG